MTTSLRMRKHILPFLIFNIYVILLSANNTAPTNEVSDTLQAIVVNDPPEAKDILLSLEYNQTLRGSLRSYVSDADNGINDLTFYLVRGPRFGAGTMTIQPNGGFQFVPKDNLEFTTSMTYAVCDVDFACDTATIRINPRHVPNCETSTNNELWLYGLRLVDAGTTDNAATKDCIYKIFVSPDTAIQDPNQGCIADVKNGDGNRLSEAAALAYSAVDTSFYYYDLFERRLVEYRPFNGTYRKVLDIDYNFVVKMGCDINGNIYFISTTGVVNNPDYLYRVTNPRSANPTVTRLGRMPSSEQYYNGDLSIDREGNMWYISSATRDSFINITQFRDVANMPESDNLIPIKYQKRIRPLAGSITLNASAIDGRGGFYLGSKNNIWYLSLIRGTLKLLGTPNFNPTSVDFATCDNPSEYLIIGYPPVGNIDNFRVRPNSSINANVATNDTDVDNNISFSSFTLLENTKNGVLNLNTDGSFSYTPNPNFIGRDSFTYILCDIADLCDTVVAYIIVRADVVLIDDNFSTNEDTPLSNTVATNDIATSDEINVNSFSRIDNPANGTLTFNANGTFTYTPNPNFFGVENIRYQACNNFNLCDTGVLTINITSVNDAPIAQDDNSTTNEDTPLSNTVATNDSDIEGLNLNSYTIVTGPLNGIINLNPNGNYTYTPNPNFSGTENIRYRVCDNGTPVLCAEATLVINVLPVNRPPLAINDIYNVIEDGTLVGNVTLNDSDRNNNINPNSYRLLDSPLHGVINWTPQGTFSYTSLFNYNGVDSVHYEVCDLGNPALCSQATVIINIQSVNDHPLVVSDISATNENTPVNGFAGTNDLDADNNLDNNSFKITIQPKNGQAVMNPNGFYNYIPNNGFNGVDSIQYEVCDLGTPIYCDRAWIIITVNPVNEPPVATNEIRRTLEDVAISGLLTSKVSDPDNNINRTSFRVTKRTTNGIFGLNTEGGWAYIPNPNFNGVDTAEYEVCDLGAPIYCAKALVIITVDPVNDPPVAVNDIKETNENVAVSDFVGTNDSDIDNNLDNTSFKIIVQPKNGRITMNQNGLFNYIPNNGFNGVDSVQYEVCDLGTPVFCEKAWIIIKVNVVNEPPVATNEFRRTSEDVAISGFLTSKVSDPDNNLNTNSFKVTKRATNGTFGLNTEGGWAYIPKPNFNGIDTAEYEVCDLGSPIYCAKALVIITVDPVNDPPSATPQPIAVGQGKSIESCTPIADIDAADSHTATLCGVQKGTATVSVSFDGKLCVQYKAPEYYDGPDTICVNLCDRANACVQVKIPVTVSGCNDNVAPTIKCPSPVEVSQIGNIIKDTDGFLKTATVADNCQGVTVSYNPPMATDDCTTPTVSLKSGVTNGGRCLLGSNILIFEAKDINGRTSTCQTEIIVTPVDLLLQTNISICAADTIKIEAKEWSNAIYTWKGPNNWAQNGRKAIIPISNEAANGNYIMTASYNNCRIEDTLKVAVKATPKPVNDVFSIKAGETISENVVKNDALVNGETYTARINQSRSNLIFNNDGSFKFTPQVSGTKNFIFDYEICYKSCPNACSTASANIEIIPILQGTNVITPNGDGKNDRLTILAFDHTNPDNKSEIIIFNQWGDIVFKTTAYQNDWDGTYNGKALPAGTYYYIFKENPTVQPIKSFITIMR
jgi:large repetitive protein